MDNYAGLLPFLWRTFKTKPKERRRRAPEKQRPMSTTPIMILKSDNEEDTMIHNQDDDAYFLHPQLLTSGNSKSPSRFGKSPSMMMFGRCSSPGRSTHNRRHSTGLSAFSLPNMLSSHSQRAR